MIDHMKAVIAHLEALSQKARAAMKKGDDNAVNAARRCISLDSDLMSLKRVLKRLETKGYEV